MKKLFVLAIALMVISAPAFAGLVNGDFSQGETGWVQIPYGGWGGNGIFSTTGGVGTIALPASGGSVGWYQIVTDIAVGATCKVTADWAGSNIGWQEVDMWSVAAGTTGTQIYSTFNAGALATTAYKIENKTWSMVAASTNSNSAKSYGGTLVNTNGWMVVALKVGKSGASASGSFDNIVLTPEPGSILALMSGLVGLGGMIIRRKH